MHWVGRRWCAHGHFLPKVGAYERSDGRLDCRECHRKRARADAERRRVYEKAYAPQERHSIWDELQRLTDLD